MGARVPIDQSGQTGRGLFDVLLGGGPQLVIGLLQGQIVSLPDPLVGRSEQTTGHLGFAGDNQPPRREPLGDGFGVGRLEGIQEIVEELVHYVADETGARPLQDRERSFNSEPPESTFVLDLRLEDADRVVDNLSPLIPRRQLRS